MKKLTDILKEAGIEMGKVYTDKDRPPFKGKLAEAKFKDIDVKKLGKKKTNDLMIYLFNIVDLGLMTDMKTDTKKKILSVNISKISPKVAQNIQKRFGVDLTEGKLTEKKKDDKIQIRGMGTWDYKSLTSNLARKIKDLDKRNKKGDHTGIGKNQLGVLVAMWEALSDYEENQ